MNEPADTICRSMTDDGSFRVITVRATETVRGVLQRQNAKGSTAKHLADLTTGSVMIRETMSPSLRVQGILKRQDKAGYLLGDSHPSGNTRGLIGGKVGANFTIRGAMLQVVRTLQDGHTQQGVVAVPDDSDISKGLMAYMQDSEQITTMIVVSTLFDDAGEVSVAGGYLVQLLPGAEQAMLAIMTERLEDFRNIDGLLGAPDFTPQGLTKELLYGMPHTELGESNFQYGCWCSRTSMMGALASLNRTEIQSMVDDGEVLEISCDYCARDYRVTPVELRGLLQTN